jgi:hypothetical protein
MEYSDSLFNTKPLITDLTNVLESGVKDILANFINRYILLEETQRKILQILSQSGGTIESIPNFVNSDTEFKKEISLTLSEMASVIHELKREIQELKEVRKTEPNIIPIVVEEEEEPVAIEKENIRLEIEEEHVKEEEEVETEVKIESDEESESDEDSESDKESEIEVQQEVESEAVKEEEQEQEQEVESEEVKEEEEEREVESEAVKEEEQDAEVEAEEEAVEDAEEEEEEAEEEAVEDAEEDAEEEEEEEAVEEVKEEEPEEELFEIDIDDVTYCTNDDQNGVIYELLEDSEVGKKIGYFKDGEPIFYDD